MTEAEASRTAWEAWFSEAMRTREFCWRASSSSTARAASGSRSTRIWGAASPVAYMAAPFGWGYRFSIAEGRGNENALRQAQGQRGVANSRMVSR